MRCTFLSFREKKEKYQKKEKLRSAEILPPREIKIYIKKEETV